MKKTKALKILRHRMAVMHGIKRAKLEITVNISAALTKRDVMGQIESSPYSNSVLLQKALVNGTWQQWPKEIIQMNNDVYDNPFQHKYIIKINSEIPANCNITVLFPNHPVEKKRLLWVQQYTQNGLSMEINRRIRDSARDGIMLAITTGNEILAFKGFTGNIYLFWAERASQQTINRQENLIGKNIPMLIETNGQMGYRNVYIFDPEQRHYLTPLKDIMWFDPISNDLFCCENDTRKEDIRIVPTVSNSYADQITTDPVVRTLIALDQEPTPYQSDADEGMLMVDSGRLINYTIHGDAKCPDEET